MENEDRDYGSEGEHFDEKAEFLCHAFTFHSFLRRLITGVVFNDHCQLFIIDET